MTIPATDVPVISFGESLKESVAKKKKLKAFITSAVSKGKKAAAPVAKKAAAPVAKKAAAPAKKKK